MAIGWHDIFGVKLPLNFHSPLRAANIADYWRRWHMTLQRMIYRYVFQPLSLFLIRGTWRLGLTGWSGFAVSVGFPTFLTFIIVGIWHGAGWTFVAFGAMHAVYVSVFEIWRERRTRLQRKLHKANIKFAAGGTQRMLGRALTLVAILYANVMFRAKTVAGAASVWAGMTGLRGASADFSIIAWGLSATLLVCATMVAFFPNTQQIMSRFDPAYNWREWRDVALPLISWTWRPTRLACTRRARAVFWRYVCSARTGDFPLLQLLGHRDGTAASLSQNRDHPGGCGRLRDCRQLAAGGSLSALAIARWDDTRERPLDLRALSF